MTHGDGWIWGMIALLGIGTFLIRFSFIGMLGGRKLPPWVLRHLRYTPVAVLPGLVAPLVLWPASTAGPAEGVRIAVAVAALCAGYLTRNALWGVVAAAATFGVGGWVF